MRPIRGLLLIGALGAFALLRLYRVPRPTFVLVESVSHGVLQLGEVSLQRPNSATATHLGWSLRCKGREILALRQRARPTLSLAPQASPARWNIVGNGVRWQIDAEHCVALLQQ